MMNIILWTIISMTWRRKYGFKSKKPCRGNWSSSDNIQNPASSGIYEKLRDLLLNTVTMDDKLKERLRQKAVESGGQEFKIKVQEIFTKMRETYQNLCEKIFDCDDAESTRILWAVFNKVYDNFMPVIKAKLCTDDIYIFEKSKTLCGMQVTAEQLGADKNFSIPLCAAIVELSIIDTYISPIDKMNCLCGAYDLVFAELKSAMVSMISKYSEKENEIPIVNNSDVIPSLMVVIIKSKLAHLASNLCYIQSFYYKLSERHVEFTIFKDYTIAMDRLKALDENSLEPSSDDNLKSSIDLLEFMRLTSQEENRDSKTLIDEERSRILDLISTSTCEDQVLDGF